MNKRTTEREYFKQVIAAVQWASEENFIKAFNSRAVAIVRYGAKIENQTIEDVEQIDRKKLKKYEICVEDCTQDLL